ncbi:MAG: tetratricopeptide repeat protein, partial [Leptolyngbya sp. SIO4C5]|nr:tetratricopeptide repeat protein [Leptolyngbya sp. SIO4C5]
HQDVLDIGQQALDYSLQTNNTTLQIISLVSLGYSYNGLEQYEQGAEYGQQALELAQQTTNAELQVRAYALLLTALSELNRHQDVLDIGQQALDYSLQTNNTTLQIISLVSLGYSYNGLEQYETALDLAQQALQLAYQITLEDKGLQVLALSVLSSAHNGLEQYETAVEYGQQALELAQQIKNIDLQTITANALIEMYSNRKQYDVAIRLGQQILEIAQENKNSKLEVAALSVLVALHGSLYNFSQAINYADQALSINQSTNSATLEIAILLELLILYDFLGAYQELTKTIQQIVSAAERLNDPSLYSIFEWMELVILSYVAYMENDLPQAIALAENSLTVALATDNAPGIANTSWLKNYSYLILAIAYGETENHPYALKLLAESEEFWQEQQDRDTEISALQIAGGIYRYHNQAGIALEKHQQALSISIQQDDTPSVALAHAGIARSYRLLDKPVAAIFHYKEAINRIESIRGRNISLDPELQTSLLEQFIDFGRVRLVDLYRELTDLLLSQGRVLEAQQALELLKKQELYDYTRSGSNRPDLSLNNVEAEINELF